MGKNTLRVAILNAILLMGGTMAYPETAYAQGQAQAYSIEAGDLESVLSRFGTQSRIQLIYPPDLLKGKRSGGLTGNHTPAEALRRLLEGSGLEAQRVNDSTVVIKEGTSPPTPASTYRPPVSEASEMQEVPTQLETILVTGSRLRRADYEGPSQVISITRQDIERSGSATVREVLNALPQNAVAMDESGANTFAGASTVRLRGLSSGSTLVLINGRRVSSYGGTFFDLNSIPIDAVDRIEVLTDTASAVYGADAIGGAVNFILRKDYEGAGVSLRYGTSSRHDATEYGGSLVAGGSSDVYSGLMVFTVYERDPLFGDARELSRSHDFRRFGGIDLRGTNTYPANVFALPGTGNLPGLSSPFAGVPEGTDGIGLTPADFVATDGVLNISDSAPYSMIVTQSRRLGAFAQGSAQVGDSSRAYGELMVSRNRQKMTSTPDSLSGGGNALFVVPAENPFNPFGIPVGVNYQFHEIGPRTNDTTNEYTRFLAGVEGRLSARLDWDVNVMSDRHQQTIDYRNFVDWYLPGRQELVQRYLGETDPEIALNVFSSTGNNNPATLDALRNDRMGVNSMRANTVEASLRGSIMSLPAGEVQLAIGGTARSEKGAFSNGVNAKTDAYALFAETSVPLMSPDQNRAGIYSADINFAVRRDHYDTFGGQTSPQLGLTWRPLRTLLVRGSYGKAFKSPSLNDLYAERVSAVSSGIPDPLRNGEVSNFILIHGGNPDIEPERARAMTLGAIWEPAAVDGLSLGATAFRIEHDDFISRYGDYQMMLLRADIFGDRTVRAEPTREDIEAGRPGRLLSLDSTATNYGGVKVVGADLDVRYEFPEMEFGRFTWTLLGSYIDKYEVQLTPGDPASNEVGRANRAGYPTRFKANTQFAWNAHSGFGASVTARYTGSYVDYTNFNNVYNRLDSQTLWDVQFSYREGDGGPGIMRGFRAELGVVNLTDNQGSFSNTFTGYDFQQADLRGRFFYLNLHKEF